MDKKSKDIKSYREFLYEMSGSGVIYEDEACDILERFRNSDWIDVSEFVAPIASEVIIDAAEINRTLYEKIMKVIIEAHETLSNDLRFSPPRPKLKRIK